MSLLKLLDLEACTGAQLDLIGEIVVLSRYDARVMVEQSYEGEVLDDDLYRKLLKWKILLNTNDCTYWSMMKGIKYFWDKSPVYYETDPEIPATILLTTPPLDPETNPRDLLEMPIIRAGGVDLRLRARLRTLSWRVLFLLPAPRSRGDVHPAPGARNRLQPEGGREHRARDVLRHADRST